jgi:hypothetical protein
MRRGRGQDRSALAGVQHLRSSIPYGHPRCRKPDPESGVDWRECPGHGRGRLTPGATRAAWPRQLDPSAVPPARRLPVISSRKKLTNPRRTSTSDTFSSRLWPASVSFRGGG